MWLVKKIGFITSSGVTNYDKWFLMSEYGLTHFNVVIHLSNTVSGDYKVLYSRDRKRFISQLRELQPYGFVDRNIGRDNIALEDVFVVIDDLSLRFLDFVESVEIERVPVHTAKNVFVEGLKGEFVGVDSDFSLFLCDVTNSRSVGATLFHAVCYSQDGWYGDEFYLYSRRSLEYSANDFVDIVYKITFVNPVEAKRFVMKFLMSGDNPLKAEQDRFKH